MSEVIEKIIGLSLSILPPLIKAWLADFIGWFFPDSRVKALPGDWTGTYKQDIGPIRLKGDGRIDMQLSRKGRRIVGKILFHADAQETFTLKVQGTLEHGSYLRINYDNTDRNVKQFGCLIFELSPKGDVVGGRYVGYGVLAKVIVSGKADLRKIR